MMVALSPRELELLLVVGLALGIGGILTPEQAVAGFSRSAVLTIVGLFVITAALEQTGVVHWIADWLAQLSGTHESQIIAVFMGAGALLSLIMNNIAAGAVLLAAAVSVARQAKVRESRLLMPLTQLVRGQVAALIAGPIAVSAAVQLRVNPSAVGVAVAIGCSAAFLTPIAHPVNVLMMGPGGYTFTDFARVGPGLTVVCFLTLLLVLSCFWVL